MRQERTPTLAINKMELSPDKKMQHMPIIKSDIKNPKKVREPRFNYQQQDHNAIIMAAAHQTEDELEIRLDLEDEEEEEEQNHFGMNA